MNKDPIFDWKVLCVRKEAAAFWFRRNREVPCTQFQDEYDQAIRHVRYAKFERHHEPASPSILDAFRQKKIKDAVKEAIIQQRPNTSVGVIVGGTEKYFRKAARGKVVVRVGYMWGHRVHKPLYQRGYDANWFILDATEYRVNVRNVAIYECLACDMDTSGEAKTIYVGQGKVEGKYGFNVAHTTNAAATRAASWVNEQVINKLTNVGEERND